MELAPTAFVAFHAAPPFVGEAELRTPPTFVTESPRRHPPSSLAGAPPLDVRGGRPELAPAAFVAFCAAPPFVGEAELRTPPDLCDREPAQRGYPRLQRRFRYGRAAPSIFVTGAWRAACCGCACACCADGRLPRPLLKRRSFPVCASDTGLLEARRSSLGARKGKVLTRRGFVQLPRRRRCRRRRRAASRRAASRTRSLSSAGCFCFVDHTSASVVYS